MLSIDENGENNEDNLLLKVFKLIMALPLMIMFGYGGMYLAGVLLFGLSWFATAGALQGEVWYIKLLGIIVCTLGSVISVVISGLIVGFVYKTQDNFMNYGWIWIIIGVLCVVVFGDWS